MRKNPKIRIKKSIVFPLLAIMFFALGTFLCREKLLPEGQSAGFFAGIKKTTLSDFISGFLAKLFPLLFIVFSGFDLLGDFYSSLFLSASSFLSGYSLSSTLWARERMNIPLLTLFTVFEAMTLATLVSSAVGQSAIRRYLLSQRAKEQKKKAILLYVEHTLFRVGILFVLYAFRCLCAGFIL